MEGVKGSGLDPGGRGRGRIGGSGAEDIPAPVLVGAKTSQAGGAGSAGTADASAAEGPLPALAAMAGTTTSAEAWTRAT